MKNDFKKFTHEAQDRPICGFELVRNQVSWSSCDVLSGRLSQFVPSKFCLKNKLSISCKGYIETIFRTTSFNI